MKTPVEIAAYINKILIDEYKCRCPECNEARTQRLLNDIRTTYGCTTVAEAQEKLRRQIN